MQPLKTRRAPMAAFVAVLVLACGLSACGGGNDDAATNRRWAKHFCTGLTTWQRTTTESSGAVQAYLKTPTVDPTAAKAKLTEYLQAATDATDQLTRDLDRAGTPAIDKREEAASSLKAGSAAVKKSLAGATAVVSTLPVDDAAAFTTGIQSANAALSAGFKQFGSALDRVNRLDTDHALVRAERSVAQCKSLLS
jgi:hypothetical protein